jgi:hypothetical protein
MHFEPGVGGAMSAGLPIAFSSFTAIPGMMVLRPALRCEAADV